VVAAVGQTATTLITNLLGDTVVQQAAGDEVANLVTAFLGDSPIAEPVGQAIGAAVQQFLAAEGVAADLGAIIGSLMPDFIDQAGVPAALGDAAGQLAVALLTGENPVTALKETLATLEADPEVQAALKITVADTLNLIDTTMLSNPTVQQALGAITTTLIEQLAASAAIRAYVAEQLGPTLGPAVAKLLADTAVVDDVATAFGSAVTQFLAYPGFSTALTDTIDQFADAVIDGTPATAALQTALAALEADPIYQAAVQAIVPGTLNSLLKNAAVREAIAAAARTAVIDLLKERGINNGFIDGIAGQVAEGTVDSFLAKPTGEALIDSVIVNVLEGMPLNQVTDTVIQAVLRDPGLQAALGTSIGTGIGSLFGDNIIGLLVGGVAGITATIVIAIASGLTLLFNGDASTAGPAATATAPTTTRNLFQPLPAPGELYLTSATVPAPHAAAATTDTVVLAAITTAGPDTTQADVLDIQMTIPTPADTNPGQLLVGFRFALNQLLSTPAPGMSPGTETRRAERVL